MTCGEKSPGAPIWKLWGLSLDRLPPTDYTIGIDTVDRMVAKLQEFPGWPIYKIKLGTADDLEIVRTLAPSYRRRVPSGRQLRLERGPDDRQLVGPAGLGCGIDRAAAPGG